MLLVRPPLRRLLRRRAAPVSRQQSNLGADWRRVVLLRHGQSTWNRGVDQERGRFTGWADPPLTQQGIDQAKDAGQVMASRSGRQFDRVFTSELSRAYVTCDTAMDVLYPPNDPDALPRPPVSRKWELNERHYGALTGLAKDDPWLEENFGEDTIVEWRRAYDARPPPMFPTHEHYHPPPAPISESLQDCEKRVAAWFKRCVAPQLKSGDWNNVLIVSHANAIRGLVKTIDDISDENIRYVKIPNGVPLVYYLDENNRPLKHLPKDSAGFMGAYLSSFANSERVKESLHCEEQWLRAAFEMIDTDGNGEVSVVELVAGLRTLKSDFDVAGDLDVGELVFQLDVNGDGLVSLDEWLASSERLKQFAPETFRLIEADAPPGQRDRNVRNTKLYGARSGRGSIMKGRRRGLRGSSRFEP